MLIMAQILLAGISIFLIGANLSFLFHLGNRLVPWFTTKVSAVTLLLVYVTVSAVYGHPAGWRVAIGTAAVVADCWALGRMWFGITTMKEEGVVGLVPLLKSREEER